MSLKRKHEGDDESPIGQSKNCKSRVTFDLERLKCTVCIDFPRNEVYLCSEGHAVCSPCIQNLDKCPYCRSSYKEKGGKTRDRFMESFLDSLLLHCAWKGCEQDGLKRQEVADHEDHCCHNPNPKIQCSIILFGNPECSFKLSRPSLEDATLVKTFLDHLKNQHKFAIFSFMFEKSREVYTSKWMLTGIDLKTLPTFHTTGDANDVGCLRVLPYGLIMQLMDSSDNQIALYTVLNLVDIVDSDRSKLSFVCIRLTAENSRTSAISMKVSLKSRSSEFPQLSWTIPQIDLFKLKQLREGNPRELPKFGFSLSLSLIREQYINEEGKFCQISIVTDEN